MNSGVLWGAVAASGSANNIPSHSAMDDSVDCGPHCDSGGETKNCWEVGSSITDFTAQSTKKECWVAYLAPYCWWQRFNLLARCMHLVHMNHPISRMHFGRFGDQSRK